VVSLQVLVVFFYNAFERPVWHNPKILQNQYQVHVSVLEYTSMLIRSGTVLVVLYCYNGRLKFVYDTDIIEVVVGKGTVL
jgi:hypothetical protein